MIDSFILTPEDPDFYYILHSKLPPGATMQCYAPDADSGILKPLSGKEEQDYCYGGEIDEIDKLYDLEN